MLRTPGKTHSRWSSRKAQRDVIVQTKLVRTSAEKIVLPETNRELAESVVSRILESRPRKIRLYLRYHSFQWQRDDEKSSANKETNNTCALEQGPYKAAMSSQTHKLSPKHAKHITYRDVFSSAVVKEGLRRMITYSAILWPKLADKHQVSTRRQEYEKGR